MHRVLLFCAVWGPIVDFLVLAFVPHTIPTNAHVGELAISDTVDLAIPSFAKINGIASSRPTNLARCK